MSPEDKYTVVYADPPWTYRDKCVAGKRGSEFHYPSMTIEDIKALPVEGIAAKDSVLFLWTTMPQLSAALDVMAAWGFKYKTMGFVWVKTSKKGKLMWGMGSWTRANAELCLMGVRGKPKRISAGVHQVLLEQSTKHSKKPDTIRDRIVKLIGDVPRVELFARQSIPGWDVWGNECDTDCVGLEETE